MKIALLSILIAFVTPDFSFHYIQVIYIDALNLNPYIHRHVLLLIIEAT